MKSIFTDKQQLFIDNENKLKLYLLDIQNEESFIENYIFLIRDHNINNLTHILKVRK
jgi:hypothetical protein